MLFTTKSIELCVSSSRSMIQPTDATPAKSAPPILTSEYARAAQQNKRRHGHGDHNHLHSLDTQVESQDAGNTLPLAEPQFADDRGKCLTVDEAEARSDSRASPGETR